MVFINGWWEALPFTVPVAVATQCLQIVCDTFDPARIGVIDRHMQVAGRSVVIPRSPRGPGHHATPRRCETLSLPSCSDTEHPGRTVTAVVIEDVGGHASAAMVPNETFEASVGNCREHIGVRSRTPVRRR